MARQSLVPIFVDALKNQGVSATNDQVSEALKEVILRGVKFDQRQIHLLPSGEFKQPSARPAAADAPAPTRPGNDLFSLAKAARRVPLPSEILTHKPGHG